MSLGGVGFGIFSSFLVQLKKISRNAIEWIIMVFDFVLKWLSYTCLIMTRTVVNCKA